MVGVAGFEPTTSCSQSRRSTKLSYTPSMDFYDAKSAVRQDAKGKIVTGKRIERLHAVGGGSRRPQKYEEPVLIFLHLHQALPA